MSVNLSFCKSIPGFHHLMMKPVFLLVIVFFIPSVSAKTLIFQSRSEASPEQVVPVAKADSGVSVSVAPAPKALNTRRQTSSANSELFFMLEQLQQEVRYLRGMLEEQANQIHHLKVNGKNRYRDIDSRVLDLSKKFNRISLPSVVPMSKPLSVGSASKVSLEPVKPMSTAEAVDLVVTPKAAKTKLSLPSDAQKREYQQAYGLIKEKNFDEAIKQLHLFIEHYPEGALAGNAYYWLGEVYLVLPKLEQARQAFSVVVSAFPDHRKAADALFKLGVSYDRLQDPARSEQYLNEVQLKYPESTAAKLAKSYKINR